MKNKSNVQLKEIYWKFGLRNNKTKDIEKLNLKSSKNEGKKKKVYFN